MTSDDLHGVVAVAEEGHAAPMAAMRLPSAGRTRCEGRPGRGETATAAVNDRVATETEKKSDTLLIAQPHD